MKTHTRAVLAAVLAGGIAVAGSATPALAASDDIWNQNAMWYDVDDTEPYIEDVQSAYRNILGTGVDLQIGWTADALDGVVDDAAVDGFAIDWTAAGGSGWVSGGLSSFSYLGSADEGAYEIEATLEIQGSYARWTFTQTGGPAGVLSLVGDHGSDGDETVTVVTPASAVVFSDDQRGDQVIGYHFSGVDGVLGAASGSDDFHWSSSLTDPVRIVLAVQDYAPCAQDEVVAQMVARVGSLDSTFGQDLAGVLDCASVAAPLPLTAGSSTSQSLDFTTDAAVDQLLGALPNREVRGGYLSNPAVVAHRFIGAPAGVVLAFDAATSTVSLSGTPTTAGTYEVTLLTYLTDAELYSGDGYGEVGDGHPLTATFVITVEGGTLAATGVDAASGWLGSIAVALVLGGVLLHRTARMAQP